MKTLAITLLASLVLTACGGDDDGGPAAAASGVETGQPIPIDPVSKPAATQQITP